MRKKKGVRNEKGDHAHPFLFFAVLDVVVAHDEAEDEDGQRGLRVRLGAEPHQQEQGGEDELDLGLDHTVAVAAEEPG